MLALLLAMVDAHAGCGALKPDAFGNRHWENSGFRIDVGDGASSLTFAVRSGAIEDTPMVDAVVTFAFDDGTQLERPAAKPSPAAASLWSAIPVTIWWVPVALDDELRAAALNSQIRGIRVVTALRTMSMAYPNMAVEVVSAANADKMPALVAKQVPDMLKCLAK